MKKSLLGFLALSAILVCGTASAELVWVANTDTNSISIIDSETDTVVAGYPVLCVPANHTCLDEPVDIAFSLDGSKAYVLNRGDGRIVTLNTSGVPSSNPTFAGYQWADDAPEGLVVNPVDGYSLYVTSSIGDVMYVYDIHENPSVPYLEDTVEVANDPGGVAVTPDGETVLVANNASNSVSFVDVTADPPTVPHTVSVGNAPRRVIVGDIDGVGVRAYTVNANSDNVSVIEVDSSPSVVITLSVGDKPRGLAFYPSKSAILVANFDGYSISKINTATNFVSTFADSLGAKPFRIAITSDGGKAYVSNPGPDQVSVFDANDGSLIEEVSVGYTPGGIAISAGD